MKPEQRNNIFISIIIILSVILIIAYIRFRFSRSLPLVNMAIKDFDSIKNVLGSIKDNATDNIAKTLPKTNIILNKAKDDFIKQTIQQLPRDTIAKIINEIDPKILQNVCNNTQKKVMNYTKIINDPDDNLPWDPDVEFCGRKKRHFNDSDLDIRIYGNDSDLIMF